MRTKSEPVESLKNIGPTIAQRLKAVGIHTKEDLQSIGPVGAYRRICRRNPGKTIPVCYYLYSLRGALLNIHWDNLETHVKEALRQEANVTRRGSAHGKRRK